MQPWQPLLDFWFGDDADDAPRAARQAPLWWGKSSETDALLASRFGELAARAAAGELARWEDDPAGRLALILLLDQLPRNLHRHTPAAFAQDDKARALCLKGLTLGVDKGLSPLARVFFYLPLEHAESREQQARSVALFEALADEQALGQAQHSVDVTLRIDHDPRRTAADQVTTVAETGGVDNRDVHEKTPFWFLDC